MHREMKIPDWAPDFTFPRLRDDAEDASFAYQAKRAALGPHVAARWGWDDVFQRRVHDDRYRTKPFFAIERAGERLGTVSIEILATYMRFGEFYILPSFQGRGIGTGIARHCLALADDLKLPVRLEYLCWNPVGTLYRRLGFVEQARSDTHVLMERPSQAGEAGPPP